MFGCFKKAEVGAGGFVLALGGERALKRISGLACFKGTEAGAVVCTDELALKGERALKGAQWRWGGASLDGKPCPERTRCEP